MGEITYGCQPAMHVTRFDDWKINHAEVCGQLYAGESIESNEFTLNETDIKVGLQLVYQTSTHDLSLQLVLKNRGSTEIQDIQCRFWTVEDGKRIELRAVNNGISENKPICEVTSSAWYNMYLYRILRDYGPTLIGCEVKHTKKGTQLLPSNFRESLWNAYKNGLYDGCTIQVEDKEFKVSKMILMPQSSVFANMFSSDSEESKTGIVKVQGIDASVMEALIQFMHLGSVENLEENAENLFVAADKYAILDLKAQCAKFIGASLSKENFFNRIVLAFKHNSDELKKHVLDFLLKSNDRIFISLLASEEWLQFGASNMKMAKEIIETVTKELKIVY